MEKRDMVEGIVRVMPTTREELREWLGEVLEIWIPGRGRCARHDSPLDYLEHVFFERGDAVVWANRGGGKTFYGAVATLLDLVFKPGIQVRILGGSMGQSGMMGDYLREMFERPVLREIVKGRMTEREIRLRNGSRVELLAQSETSVRGQRVQKLRCDEVDLFAREVWEAAQFVTRSKVCGGVEVRGSVEAMSTMHRVGGLMEELVGKAKNGGWKLFTWCALDVMGRCELVKECVACELGDYCDGRAREWRGYLDSGDVIGQRGRSSRTGFESEILCRGVSRTDAVYAAFDAARHVREVEVDARLKWVCGVDFGIRDFVWLWAQLRPAKDGRLRVEVMDELAVRDRTLEANVEEVKRRGWPTAAWLGVDPAGQARSDQTGVSAIEQLRKAGFVVRARRALMRDGLEAVRSKIDPSLIPRFNEEKGSAKPQAAEESLFVVHPRCEKLIEALRAYRFDLAHPESDEPVKDGHDHAADALRYLVVNLETAWAVKQRGYW